MSDLESEVLEHLHGMDAQMVSEVARAVKADPFKVRKALHNLRHRGDVLMFETKHGAELFEAAHGGYIPPGRAA